MNILLIRQKMIERGLTQEDLAIACGLERKAIQRILSSQVKRPHNATIKKLSEFLRVSPVELTENKAVISRRKLLKFMLEKYGVHGWCDYFIFRKADKLENSDLKTLINDYGLYLPDISKDSGEANHIKFDEVKLLLHMLNNPVDINAVYMYKNLTLRSMRDFIQCSKSYLRCRPLQAWELLECGSKSDKMFLWKKALNYYAMNLGLDLKSIGQRVSEELPDIPEGFFNDLEKRPLEGETDAKVLRSISDILNVNPNKLLCPESLL